MFKHHLLCLGTGKEMADDGLILADPRSERDSLLRTVYSSKELQPRDELPGIYRFSDWLPVDRTLQGSAAPVTYRSTKLSARLGLSRLYITFSGFWEDIGASMTTGTFKECEAYSVCARFPGDSDKTLVVASAGNTARAFIKAASENGVPLIVVVPKSALELLRMPGEKAPNVKLVALDGGADYLDAIKLADRICRMPDLQSEGGAKNVARRDGLGVTVLSAAEAAGEIPDYYFQAVGSGTGAIAAHEANLRLNESGRFAPKAMKLVLSQNAPFAPIFEAWRAGRRGIEGGDEEAARKRIAEIDAKALSNRNPPYGIVGGLYDSLAESGGEMIAVSNGEERAARALFLEIEGCDICPEAGVAVASLCKKAAEESLDRDALVMLNITGGGYSRIEAARRVRRITPDLVLHGAEYDEGHFRKSLGLPA